MQSKLVKGLGALLAALTLLHLAGCAGGSFLMIGAVENQTFSSFEASYQKFSGCKSYSITLNDDETAAVTVTTTTEDGTLGFAILNTEDESFCDKSGLGDESFSVTLDRAGTYILKVTGEDHKGSFHVAWDIQK